MILGKFKRDFQQVVRQHSGALVAEVRETTKLIYLLIKVIHQPLSAEEKQKVSEQLLDVIKIIPVLIIFSLPGGTVLLALLVKTLPFNILPSNFQKIIDEED